MEEHSLEGEMIWDFMLILCCHLHALAQNLYSHKPNCGYP